VPATSNSKSTAAKKLENVEAVNKKKAQTPNATSTGVRTFIIDTSVLLSDPRAMFRFAEHEVVLPIVVINELEKSETTWRLVTLQERRCAF
jgi:Predicted ATPase related to phosphate starvation-inducible protein PhoH